MDSIKNALQTFSQNPSLLLGNSDSGRYTLAIQGIENGNKEAQDTGINGILESALISAFSKK